MHLDSRLYFKLVEMVITFLMFLLRSKYFQIIFPIADLAIRKVLLLIILVKLVAVKTEAVNYV